MIHLLSPLYSQSHYSLLLIHRNQCAVTDPHRGAFMALQVTRYPVKGMWSKIYIYVRIGRFVKTLFFSEKDRLSNGRLR